MTSLCYFRFFKYCEKFDCVILPDERQKYTTFKILSNKIKKTIIVAVNKEFNEYSNSIYLANKILRLDLGEILIYCKKEKRPDGPITEYENRFNKVTTFHAHCK